MANLFPIPTYQAIDGNGNPISGAMLYFYEAGTTNPADTYSNNALTTANANPVIADSAGRFGAIYMQAIDYKVILKDASGVTIWTRDPVHGVDTVLGNDFAASQQSPADMTVLVTAGALFDVVNKTLISKSAQTSALITAPVTNPRYDIVYIDRLTGVIGVATGAEAASPSDPTLPNDKLPICRVSLTTATTEITDSDITDIRHLDLIGSGDVVRYAIGVGAGALALNDQDWTDVASAATVDVFGAATESVNITGTTGISAFTAATAGLIRRVKFAASLTLTHNATSFILPGGVNITTAAGDTAEVISESTGTRFLSYAKADGQAVSDTLTAGTYTDATNGGANDLAQIDFTGIPSWVRRISVQFVGISDDTAGAAENYVVQIGESSGGIDATGYTSYSCRMSNAAANDGRSATNGFVINLETVAGTIYGRMVLELADAATNTWVADHTFGIAGGSGSISGGGIKALSGTLDRLRIAVSTGNFDAGSFNILYE